MFMITMPIIVIYWQSHGLSMRDIFVLQVIFSIAIVVLEVPSGYFADRFGRTTSIKLGSVAATVGYFAYWYFPMFWGFVLAEILLALSVSFLSGAKEALLHESLDQSVRNRDNIKWQSRLFIAGNISEATAAIAASVVLIWYTLETVLMLQWLIMALTIPLAFFLYETRHTKDVPTPALVEILKGSFYRNKKLVALNIYTAGFSAATLCMVWFMQPHWKFIGVDLVYFGYLWAGLNVVVALGASLADRLEKRFLFRNLFLLSLLILVSLYVAMTLLASSLWALLIAPGFWLLRGISFPIITDYVQRESKDEEKATVLSINKLGGRLVFSVASPFLGWLVDVYSFATAFAASALIFGVICSLGVATLYLTYLKPVSKVS